MFERFTKAARAVVMGAQAQARELGHQSIGTEHTLLALVSDENGPVTATLRSVGVDRAYVREAIIQHVGDRSETAAVVDRDAEDAAALKSIGIDLDAVRAAIEENFGAGALHLPRPAPKKKGIFGRLASAGGHVPFSSRNKKVLELSLREALRLKHNFIAPEHIMLGILREGRGLAALILAERGVDFDALRDDLARSLNTPAA
ncbi:Clp protease N-terminal domain-containing protein [Actinoplanes sp. NEAU-A12]|uniref:Clp protease N-terminal domain-containing protein n=1 Tax=Actinoplanes sandaracinus TaxID=3045177 RepID=A0ABT6WP36_9ACTN|nr:Clp protease N-terminal domain-containing protein [Actinoplanes sandaracinus]MDI6101498.1 Clp protease N-terminal domain-containing protein [Actinoplanes sandaracinus]